MEIKCKKCGSPLEFDDCYDTDGGLDDGYIMEKRSYTCPKCNTEWLVGLNVPIPTPTEKDIIWFKENN